MQTDAEVHHLFSVDANEFTVDETDDATFWSDFSLHNLCLDDCRACLDVRPFCPAANVNGLSH